MPTTVRNWAMRLAAGVPTLLTLVALAALALWGWHNDWRLSPARPAEPRSEKQAGAEPAIKVIGVSTGSNTSANGTSTSEPVRIEFPSAAAVEKVGIKTVPVRVESLSHLVTAPGMVDYDHRSYARLTSRATGIIWRVYKHVGEPIHKGEVLALIDAAEVGQLKSDFLQDLAQAKYRAATAKRLEGLDEQGAVSEASLRAAQTALREARIRLFKDQQALANLGLPVRLEEMEKLPEDQLARRLRLLGLPDAIVRDLDVETLTANLLPLTAPFDGQVVERNAAMGEVIQTTQPKTLFIVADVRDLHIDLDVNPEDMAAVRVGQKVLFRPNDGNAEKVSGQVSHISPEVNDKTRRVQVHAEVRNKDRRLRPNTYGTGEIAINERPKALIVPADAVQSDSDTKRVFVKVSATTFEARPVRVDHRQGDLVEVSGVREGEDVVTTGSYLLRSELQKDRIAGGDE